MTVSSGPHVAPRGPEPSIWAIVIAGPPVMATLFIVEVPSKKIPYFKPGKELKELINKVMAEQEATEATEKAASSE